MKKLLTILLALLMIFTLAGCGGNKEENEPIADATDTVSTPDGAVTTISSDGDVRILMAIDGRNLVISENGWHPTLSSEEGTALTFKRVGGEQYALLDESTGMAMDVYENKTGEEGTLVAMYELDTSAPGMKFTPVKNETNGTFSFKTVDGLYLSYEDGATDMTLSANPMEFYLISTDK